MDLSEKAWENRYLNNDIGWDLGIVSPPLKVYFDQLENKELKIVIPGGGNAHEAEYLFNSGFVNVFVVDLSKTAIDNIKKRIPEFPSSHLILGDFFEVDDAFDLIIEQTFFCALNPNLRENYAQKMHQILKVKGTLAGLFFSIPLYSDRPPFGGNKKEYLSYFQPYFKIHEMSPCYNSYSKRNGKELFVKLTKK